jgi:hypothetical protein
VGDGLPERWLSEDGRKLRFVPSHKFMEFNSGPRLCLGKDIASIVLWNFDVKMLDGRETDTKLSCLL